MADLYEVPERGCPAVIWPGDDDLWSYDVPVIGLSEAVRLTGLYWSELVAASMAGVLPKPGVRWDGIAVWPRGPLEEVMNDPEEREGLLEWVRAEKIDPRRQ